MPAAPPAGALLSADNRLFALARTGHLRLPQSWLAHYPFFIDKIAYPLVALIFAFLVPVLSAFLGLPLAAAGGQLAADQPDLAFALILIATFLPVFVLLWFWLRLVEQRPLWTAGMTRPVLQPYLRGLAVGLILLGVVVIVLGLAGFLEIENTDPNKPWWGTLAGVLLVLVGWLVQGAAEELLARGFLMPVLGIRWGPLAAVLISSLFFSVLHLGNPNLNALSLLNLFLFGLFAALYALNEGGLWGIFAIHAIWNWAQGNLVGFSVSGLSIRSSILLDLAEAGPDWITGGSFGPEGGVVVTFVLLAAMLVLMRRSRRQATTQPPAAGEETSPNS